MENTTLMPIGNSSEIVIYQPDDTIRLEVRMDDETVWLTQAQMAWLFDTTPQNITIHIHNLYKEEELTKSATCKDFLQVQNEGGRSIQRRIKCRQWRESFMTGKSLTPTRL